MTSTAINFATTLDRNYRLKVLLVEAQGHWYPIEWSRDGARLLVAEYVSVNESRLYVVDVADALDATF